MLRIVALLLVAAPASAAPTDMAARYARAELAQGAALVALVRNETLVPYGTGNGGEFWYPHEIATGGDYRLVSGNGSVRPAFDAPRLAAAVARAMGAPADAAKLDVQAFVPGISVALNTATQTINCTLDDYACTVTATPPRDPHATLSPDGKMALFTRENNAWLRDTATGAERPLTSDGEAYHPWGKYPDANLLALEEQRVALPFAPWGFTWSPDGRYLVGSRVGERGVIPYNFLESVPADGSFAPKPRPIRVGLIGDQPPPFEAAVFDAATGKPVPIALPPTPVAANLLDIIGWSTGWQPFLHRHRRAELANARRR